MKKILLGAVVGGSIIFIWGAIVPYVPPTR